MSEFRHDTVLLEEAVVALAIRPEGVYVDGTFGRGGHSRRVLDQLGDKGRLYVFDKDPAAAAHFERIFGADERVEIQSRSFAELQTFATEVGLVGQIDGLLLDLGVSSPQLDDAARGFSFQQEGPLDMRMDTTRGESAAEWLATAEADEITRVLKEYGEEKFARRIAHAIVQRRESQPIVTTTELSELIKEASPVHDKHKHPATRSFQAIRIFINRELEDLSGCLEQALDVLAVGARLVVISFHSLEDRIVKRFMRKHSRGEQLPRGVPVRAEDLKGPRLKLIGKPARASDREVAMNPRARSAIMRVAEVLA